MVALEEKTSSGVSGEFGLRNPGSFGFKKFLWKLLS